MHRNDHSNNYWPFAFAYASTEIAAHAIIDWWAAFGAQNNLISDGPEHFKNETVCLVAKGLVVTYDFTLLYSPYRNGAVGRLGKVLFRILLAIRSEVRSNGSKWPVLLLLVQSAINNVPSRQRPDVKPIKTVTIINASPLTSTLSRLPLGKPAMIKAVGRDVLPMLRVEFNWSATVTLWCEMHYKKFENACEIRYRKERYLISWKDILYWYTGKI